ncbi:MAG: hypothetical protein AMJ90_07890 [candidate division Zixibacteria bacterium SM23_73_2]|nr:MAG: hypothetical protein AMJ90_07890 [candidate division Zixibacteria bacterium SM23_73_2]
MKKLKILIVTLISLSFLPLTEVKPATVTEDFSCWKSINELLILVKKRRRFDEPLWNKAASCTGYKEAFGYLKVDAGIDESKFKTILRTSFGFEQEPTRSQIIKSFPYEVKFFVYAYNHLDSLQPFCERLEKSNSGTKAQASAQKYLDEGDLPANVKIVYLFEGHSLGASRYNNNIYVDVISGYILGSKNLSSVLAREIYHLGEKVQFVEKEDEGFKSIQRLLHLLCSMGISNLAGSVLYSKPEKQDEILNAVYKKFNGMQRNLKQYFTQAEQILSAALVEGKSKEEIEKEITDNFIKTSAYHILGYKMAQVIEENLGIARVKEVRNDPVKFVIMYQEAAKKSGKEFVFNQKIIEALQEYVVK